MSAADISNVSQPEREPIVWLLSGGRAHLAIVWLAQPAVWCCAEFEHFVRVAEGEFEVCPRCVIDAVRRSPYDSAIGRWWRAQLREQPDIRCNQSDHRLGNVRARTQS